MSRRWSTSSRPTAPGTASACRPWATSGSARPTASSSRSSSRTAGASRTASPTPPSPGYASFFGAARSLLSPTTDISFTDTLTLAQGRPHAEGRRPGHPQPQGPERPLALRGQRSTSTPAGNPNIDGQRLRRRAARQLPHATREAQTDPRRLLPLLPGRRLRHRQLARAAQPQRRGRHALPVAPADLHAGEQHGELRSRRSTTPPAR